MIHPKYLISLEILRYLWISWDKSSVNQEDDWEMTLRQPVKIKECLFVCNIAYCPFCDCEMTASLLWDSCQCFWDKFNMTERCLWDDCEMTG